MTYTYLLNRNYYICAYIPFLSTDDLELCMHMYVLHTRTYMFVRMYVMYIYIYIQRNKTLCRNSEFHVLNNEHPTKLTSK